MPFVAAAKVKCVSCEKTVYSNEELRIGEGITYHKACFRCSHCNKVLQNTTYSQYMGVIYCKPHFMALFKARGKYDDLATGDAANRISAVVSDNLSRTASLSVSDLPAPARDAAPKKKDMASALRARNADAVKALIEKRGLGVCFQAGADGVSAIEQAFANGNIACGRVMIQAIQEALLSKDYEMDKHVEEEEKLDAPRPYAENAAFSSTMPVHNMSRPHVEPVAEVVAPAPVKRNSIQDQIRRFSDPKVNNIVAEHAAAREMHMESAHHNDHKAQVEDAAPKDAELNESPMSSPESDKRWDEPANHEEAHHEHAHEHDHNSNEVEVNV